MAQELPTRRAAIRIIEEGHAEIRGLIDRLRPRDVTRQEIGRGRWSAKDVIGHMATWERFALEALEAWDRDRPWARESDLWNTPPWRNRYVASCQNQPCRTTKRGVRPRYGTRSTNSATTNITTFAMMIHLTAGEIGPGPKA